MGNTEIDIDKLDKVANRLRSMAHPMRIAIIELLKDNQSMNVTEIYTILNIEQPSASHHLNMLKDKGILASKRVGKNTYYSLKQEALDEIFDCINRCQ